MVAIARATNTGIFYANSSLEFNEVSYSGIRLANNYIYSTEFIEVENIQKSMRFGKDGKIYANNYFSEVTNINTGAVAPSYISTPSTFVNAGIVANTPFSVGNSYSFGGNNTSYITVAGNSAFAYGTGDFTIEWFQFETDTNGFPRTFVQGTGSTFMAFDTEASFGTLLWYGATYGNFGSVASTMGTYKNVWLHMALVRISGVIRLYRNGVQVGSALSIGTNFNDSSSTFYIGAKGNAGLSSEAFGGRITNFRVVKGLGVYTGNFTVPTSALTAVASANPYGGSNTSAITTQTVMLLAP